MNIKYVAKAIIPYTEETNASEEGPYYRYFKSSGLEKAAEYIFENRHSLFAGGNGVGDFFGCCIGALGFESVEALALKEVREKQWHVILDRTEYGSFTLKKNHRMFELDIVKEKYKIPFKIKSRKDLDDLFHYGSVKRISNTNSL